MYALYERIRNKDKWAYKFKSTTSLFGCRNGQIPRLLRESVSCGQSEPFKWHLDVPNSFARIGFSNSTLIIDLKPLQGDTNLSLYELLDVWGYSSYGWTPVMMRLRGLFVDADPTEIDRQYFSYDMEEADDPIFSVMYLAGTIVDGELKGRWTAPGPSSTNGVLMWPEVMMYFTEEAQRIMRGESK